MMNWQMQRGIAQLIIGICCALFALSMFVRSYRQDGIGWPVPWRMLVAVWIAAMGQAFLLHSYYWLAGVQTDLGDRQFVWPINALAVLSIVVLVRWFKDDPTKPEGPKP